MLGALTSATLLASILNTATGASAFSQTNPPTIVDLGYAQYQGTFNATGNTTDFLGIRYAAPPVGNLRFQAPQPPLNESSLGVQAANIQPVGCPQGGEGSASTSPFRNNNSVSWRRQVVSEPEDCLLLNVFVSGELDPAAKLPVLVWIHGGGYTLGNNIGLSGDYLISEGGGGLVVVNMEYRLGVFGFLPGSEVKQKGALNAGLLDQRASLEWIQQYIHLFGGDPDRVTIWGESAGAGSVIQHMVANKGNTWPPLFKQAMTSSTFLPSQYNYDDPISEQIYNDVVNESGCSSSTDTFQCLVEADESILEGVNANLGTSDFFGTFVPVPVVDGDFIVERPVETILKGKLNGDRYLAMTNAFEGTIFVNETIVDNMTLADYVAQLVPQFSEAQIEATVAQYTDIGLNSVYEQAISVMGESIFICPSYYLLENFNGPKYKGEFAIPPATHGEDLPYYFPSDDLPFGLSGATFTNPQFLASFPAAFTGFAKFGDPNVHPVPDVITPQWNTYNISDTEMLFNMTENGQPDIRPIQTDNGLLERCAFWQSVAPTFPQ